MRRFANKRERGLLIRLQNGCCAICQRELGLRFEVDHLVPFSQNGSTKLCNLQALCLECHSRKSCAKANAARLSGRKF